MVKGHPKSEFLIKKKKNFWSIGLNFSRTLKSEKKLFKSANTINQDKEKAKKLGKCLLRDQSVLAIGVIENTFVQLYSL